MSDLQQPLEPQATAEAPGGDGPAANGAADRPGQTSPVGRLAATVERLRREVREAQAEADGRALIELAKGILVERLGCGRRRPRGSSPNSPGRQGCRLSSSPSTSSTRPRATGSRR